MDECRPLVPGCSNAFAIVLLVTAIYAILGVQFFRYVGEGDMKAGAAAVHHALATPRHPPRCNLSFVDSDVHLSPLK
jgi:hypothetical protein